MELPADRSRSAWLELFNSTLQNTFHFNAAVPLPLPLCLSLTFLFFALGFSKMARASSSIPLKHKVDVVVDPKENTQKSRCFHVDRI